MKKFLRITLKSVAAIVVVVALALATTSIINVVATNSEHASVQPYGQLVPVDGKNMNVSIQGDGAETVVLLPGFGTASPVLDFAPLVDELQKSFRVVVIEPFGYGLSDGTEKDRTNANIVDEIHEALQVLEIERYALMGHSIAGIYGLDYVNKYRDEVTAFVGIDSSVPTQPGMDEELPVQAMMISKSLGLTRVLVQLTGDAYAGLPYTDAAKEQMKILSFRNNLSPTYVNEIEHIPSNFADAQALSFPADLPLLLFVQADNIEIENWLPLHEEQTAGVDRGELVTMDAGHYLHHTKSKQISDTVNRFMSEVIPTP